MPIRKANDSSEKHSVLLGGSIQAQLMGEFGSVHFSVGLAHGVVPLDRSDIWPGGVKAYYGYGQMF
ncbi:hypothetical protein AC579_769 [Pseudocercospora musae]|uniref:Uncharacterized protein n=1 Tax=Pseudocercospora musae TaxID=113226 RepID=A0A139IJJ4_9PEZI|nr:hypothetical protein AC579_769 [Pseudocercospora musae]